VSGLRWTDDQLADWRKRREQVAEVAARQPKPPAGPKFRSKAEARYAAILESQRAAGQIDSWRHEAVTLTLANGVRYTPDFLVVERGRMTLIEVKGFMREAARVRLRVAVEQYPHFGWCLIWAKKGGFEPEKLR
jgi:hypothetical protein